MLNVHWEVSETSPTKKEIEKELDAIAKKLFSSPFFVGQKRADISVIFCDSQKIRALNRDYRAKNASTDVLSFAERDFDQKNKFLEESDSLGEIFINYDWLREGKDHGLKGLQELFTHGALHLAGFDHEKDNGEMRKMEKKLKIFLLASFKKSL